MTISQKRAYGKYREVSKMVSSLQKEKKDLEKEIFSFFGNRLALRLSKDRVLKRRLVTVAPYYVDGYIYPRLEEVRG